jgi:Ser/Thr protein kinase RdoA (MazF antagonist)
VTVDPLEIHSESSLINTSGVFAGSLNGSMAISSVLQAQAPVPGGRENFGRDELVVALSHYQLGPVHGVIDFVRGSFLSPKVVLRTQHGDYLFRRRPRGQEDLDRLGFVHEVQIELANKGLSVPRLIGTALKNSSMLRLDGALYEMQTLIQGDPWSERVEQATSLGDALARMHMALRGFNSMHSAPTGSYHAARTIGKIVSRIPTSIQQHYPDVTGSRLDRLEKVVVQLSDAYMRAAEKADAKGLGGWPRQVIHANLRPSKALFDGNKLVGMLDFDSVRLGQRVLDVAHAAYHCAAPQAGRPDQMVVGLHAERFKSFFAGYDAVKGATLTFAEVEILPHLMLETMVAEGMIAVAATGRIGKIRGDMMLEHVLKQARWLEDNAAQIVRVLQ